MFRSADVLGHGRACLVASGHTLFFFFFSFLFFQINHPNELSFIPPCRELIRKSYNARQRITTGHG